MHEHLKLTLISTQIEDKQQAQPDVENPNKMSFTANKLLKSMLRALHGVHWRLHSFL